MTELLDIHDLQRLFKLGRTATWQLTRSPDFPPPSALSLSIPGTLEGSVKRLGPVVQSKGRVGSALDNAVSESFNSVLKAEFVHRQSFATRAEARIRIASWIADFYNMRRRHSAAGGLAPTEFERTGHSRPLVCRDGFLVELASSRRGRSRIRELRKPGSNQSSRG